MPEPLSSEKNELRLRIVQAGSAPLYGMWTMYGAVGALLIGAASVVATRHASSSPFAIAVSIAFGVILIVAALSSFRAHVAMYDALLKVNDLVDGVTPEEKSRSEENIRRVEGRIKWNDWVMGISLVVQVVAVLSLLAPILFP